MFFWEQDVYAFVKAETDIKVGDSLFIDEQFHAKPGDGPFVNNTGQKIKSGEMFWAKEEITAPSDTPPP